jgi:hypothetical protein
MSAPRARWSMRPLRQRGAAPWFLLAMMATGVFALLGAGLTWSAAPRTSGALGIVDFTPDGTQPGLMHGLEDPSACSGCHGDFTPGSADSSFLPFNTWGGSMMAHAARDPLFWAALDVANADAEDAGVPGVGDYCLRCHTPNGWLEGRVRKTTIGEIVDGQNGCLLTGDHDDPDQTMNDYSGITCHFCHRLTEQGPGGEIAPQGNGNFWVDDADECVTSQGTHSGPCRRGPYDYSASDPLAPQYHGWVYSSFHDRGPICGTCHDVSTPITSDGPFKTLILPDGSDSGIPMPVERTFTEWQRSDYADVVFRDRFGDDFDFTPQLARGAACQDCHMASSEDPLARACKPFNPEGSRTGNLPMHEFTGANTWIPAIIRDEYGAGIGGSSAATTIESLNATIDRARQMLTERSATIETSVAAAGVDQIEATVKVTNLAGHKLPTGYAEGRRMWLHVVARNASNDVVWENGAWNSTTGELAEDSQTRIYETVQGIWNPSTMTCETKDDLDRKQFHFVLNNCIAKDNRIPPLGFTGGTDLETRPVGHAYPPGNGAGTLANYDIATYLIPLPPGTTGEITVTATLKFQIASDDYVTFLRDQAVERGFAGENAMCSAPPFNRPAFTVGPQGQTRGEYMFDLWSDPAYGRSPPEDMVSAAGSVKL